MSEVRLDQVLSRLPSGLPLPVGCWLVGRVANAIAAQPRALTPRDIRIREDGGVRVAEQSQPLPFAYRAPEVIRGGPENARSAVFALGAVLVETLTGRSAFERGSDMETRVAVAAEEVAPLKGRVAQASTGLDEIIRQALAKSPDARLSSTVELAERLDAFLEEELHDVGPEAVVAAVRAAIGGGDPRAAFQKVSEESVVKPLPTGPDSGPPVSRPLPSVRKPTPAPTDVVPAQARAALTEPEAGVRRPTPAPIGATVEPPQRAAGIDLPRLEAAPAPSPARPPPARPQPAQTRDGYDFSNAELDLGDTPDRHSAPNKPRLDEELVRIGDPSQIEAGAGITEASVTGVRDSGSHAKLKTVAGVNGMLDIDEHALQQERQRPVTIREEPEPEPGPNWIVRIGLVLVAILALAIAYQFVLRPLLRD